MFEKIKKGDTVGVIAPSSKIDKDDLEVINNFENNIKVINEGTAHFV